MIRRYIEVHYPEDTIQQLFSLLPPTSHKSSYGRELHYFINNLTVGSCLPNFASPDTSGNQVEFSAIKRSYVLVDFWASWCVPCREGHPELLKIFNAYQTWGFTIVSISLDDKASAWKGAIRKDRLPWTQLSDLKQQSEMVKLLRVKSVPFNYLVNDQGVIIAKNIFGNDLDQLLRQKLMGEAEKLE